MKNEKSNRREFLKLSAAGLASLGILKQLSPTEKAFAALPIELNEMTVFEMQNAMKSGKFSARMLVEAYLEQIKQIDPKIKDSCGLHYWN